MVKTDTRRQPALPAHIGGDGYVECPYCHLACMNTRQNPPKDGKVRCLGESCGKTFPVLKKVA